MSHSFAGKRVSLNRLVSVCRSNKYCHIPWNPRLVLLAKRTGPKSISIPQSAQQYSVPHMATWYCIVMCMRKTYVLNAFLHVWEEQLHEGGIRQRLQVVALALVQRWDSNCLVVGLIAPIMPCFCHTDVNY